MDDKNKPLEITGKLLTRNWILNLVGQALPLVVALPTMPYVIRGLGTERFGILSIAWVLLSYTTALDLGLGRATTKFAAEYLGRGEHDKLSGIVWTSVWAQAVLGSVGTAVAAAVTPLVVDRLLKISASLQYETKISFFILAASLPIVLIGNVYRGLLEAGQRFDLVNCVRIPANASIFLLPALAVPLRLGLPGILSLLVVARLGATVTYLILCLKQFPTLRRGLEGNRNVIRTLLVYGGWVTVSNAISPLMTYLDRFFIGAMVSMTAVGYYTAPYEAVSRTTILAGSLTATIFPAFSSLDASGSQERLEELCERSVKSLLLALGPILILVICFAREILSIWLGPEFAARGTFVLQVLAVGTLINSLAYIPAWLLQAVGRPDLGAKFHLLELPLYIGALVYLLPRMGIGGAALAWTARVFLDAVLLFVASYKLNCMRFSEFARDGFLKTIAALTLFCGLLVLLVSSSWPYVMQSVFSIILLALFGAAAWRFVLDTKEKSLLIATAGQFWPVFFGADRPQP
jgi:O-antigen/teichoic acid export membrane protein